ncbi:MAG: ribosome biogenesis GTPase YlqF [Gammaproteobacteria bacterium]|nr:ribosome biogenesis GTPase YlqF [Gammaproteobacteria bacterium]
MLIQWYPGHMHKAGREIKEALSHADLAIEILDARIPYSSENPFLAKLRGDKPCLKVLNKCDLADPAVTATWQAYFEQKKNVKTLAVNKEQTGKIRFVTDLCQQLMPPDRTPDKLITALIMGIPNVGKSTLINILAGRAIAKTGDEPAVTKCQQRIAIGQNIVLLDTPGMLWPNIDNRHSGYRLAATGGIKDTAISHEDVATYVLEYLAAAYPQLLMARFNLSELSHTAQKILADIGRKRGCLRAGGAVDADKAGKIVLTELRSGLLGTISLETPAMMAEELAELDLIRQAKAEKKQARKARRKPSGP